MKDTKKKPQKDTPSKKLSLRKESLRLLQPAELNQVGGGEGNTSVIAGTSNPTSSVG